MSASTEESQNNITISDQPAAKDSLGLTPYVIAMTEFLTHPDTKPPLTISIEGEWGSGKSSFMKQLEDQIKVKSKETKKEQQDKLWKQLNKEYFLFSDLSDIRKFLQLRFDQETQTVWFNAWRHEKAESLWATFAISFLEQISQNRDLIDFIHNAYSYFVLFWKRLDFQGKPIKTVQIIFSGLIISSIIVVIIAAIIDITFLRGGFSISRVYSQYIKVVDIIVPLVSPEEKQPTKTNILNSDNGQKDKQDNPFLSLSLLFGGAGGSWIGVAKLLSKLKELIGDPKMDLTKYLESPDYNKQVAFIEKFHADFRKIVEAYVGKDEKVYVFIDDLDRCELGKAADLLQALHMMISNDPQIIFILGMDREKVAAGITYKQKEVLPYLASISGNNQDTKENNNLSKQLDYGFSYLEKFVQLSFTLPKPSENSLNDFFGGLATTDKENNNYPEKRILLLIPKNVIIEKIDYIIKIINSVKDQGIREIYYIKLEIRKKLQKSKTKKKDEPQKEVVIDSEIPKSKDEQQQEVVLDSEIPKSEDDTVPENDTQSDNQGLAMFPIIKKHLEKEEKEDLIKMVSPFFDNNPRRLKQYINALKLKRYIYYYTSGVTWEEKDKITQQQLGKFVAITIKYPRLLLELGNNDKLLYQLEECAIGKSKQSNPPDNSHNTETQVKEQVVVNYGDANYWINTYPKLAKLLCSGVETNKKLYSLENIGITTLLEVSQKLELPPEYFKLREFLEENKWKEADKETLNVMLKVANREEEGYLNIEAIKNFPCKELQIIDQLWVKYSGGRFGFSVQKKIYQYLGGTSDFDSEIWEKFGDVVGWFVKGDGWLSYKNLNFTFTPPLDNNRSEILPVPASERMVTEKEQPAGSTKETDSNQYPSCEINPLYGHLPWRIWKQGEWEGRAVWEFEVVERVWKESKISKEMHLGMDGRECVVEWHEDIRKLIRLRPVKMGTEKKRRIELKKELEREVAEHWGGIYKIIDVYKYEDGGVVFLSRRDL